MRFSICWFLIVIVASMISYGLGAIKMQEFKNKEIRRIMYHHNETTSTMAAYLGELVKKTEY